MRISNRITSYNVCYTKLLRTDGSYQESQTLALLEEFRLATKISQTGASGFQELLNAVSIGKPYDVAIVDEARIRIPADQLASVIRSEPQLQDLVLLLVSAEPMDKARTQFLRQAGYALIVTPPLQSESFRNALYYALAVRGSYNFV